MPSKNKIGAWAHIRAPSKLISLPLLQLFRKLVITCLNQAMNDGATSICFPTIGTGYLMYKPELSAKNMFQAISEYANDNPRSSIDIYIVIRNSAESLKKNLKASAYVNGIMGSAANSNTSKLYYKNGSNMKFSSIKYNPVPQSMGIADILRPVFKLSGLVS